MTVGSLFSGIGGLDLGLERAGHRVLWQVESNAYCRRVLARHWPHVPCYTDVTTVTGHDLAPVDLLCGGFPCQPVSHAGKQKGTDDDRWLWPEFHRLIDVLRPRYVLVENVPGLFTANGGAAFRGILADLAISGYDAEWDCLPAAAVGAPHLRYRVFLVAVANGTKFLDTTCERPMQNGDVIGNDGSSRVGADADGRRRHQGRKVIYPGRTLPPASGEESREPQFERVTQTPDHRRAGTADVADANRPGRQEQRGAEPVGPQFRSAERGGAAMADADSASGRPKGATGEAVPQPGTVQRSRRRSGRGGKGDVADADHQRCVGGRQPEQRGEQGPRWREPDGRLSDGRFFDAQIGGQWTVEPSVGRVAHGVPHRVDRLKALGNAVVPQVAEWIGRRLNDAS